MDHSQPIFARVHEIGTIFISLERALRDPSRFAAQVRPQEVNDEFDRFKIWAGNLSAHRRGRRSLEYRLRDAAHLKNEANILLTTLYGSLWTSLTIVEGKRTPWDELTDSDSDTDSDAGLFSATGDQKDTELKQLLSTIKSAITCLFRLSMAIRNPAPYGQSRSVITIDKSHYQEWDMQHIKAKFPDCASYLVERLGRASSGRRQYLSYCEEHHRKLAEDVDLIGLEIPKTEYSGNSTEATPAPKPTAHSLTMLDDDEDEILSQTSYATSVNATIRVPSLPKQAHEQEHFECPICFMVISIHSSATWKQHVYRDLHCYCCTFKECATADRLYDSRQAWFAHEMEAHRAAWQCIEGCERTFSLEQDFHAHIEQSHPELNNPILLAALQKSSVKRAALSETDECPLCNQRMTLRLLKRHVARHQEQLALFALPVYLGDPEDEAQSKQEDLADTKSWQDEGESDLSDRLDAENSADENENSADIQIEQSMVYPVLEQESATRNNTESDVFDEPNPLHHIHFSGNEQPYEGSVEEAIPTPLGERGRTALEQESAQSAQQRSHSTFGHTSTPEQVEAASQKVSPQHDVVPVFERANPKIVGHSPNHDDRGLEYVISVSNLGPEVNVDVLAGLFHNKYSSCTSVRITTDPVSGRSLGFGFVRFAALEDYQRALSEMQGVHCGNRPMQISPGPKSLRRKGPRAPESSRDASSGPVIVPGGRHSNDWLFEDFSLRQGTKGLFKRRPAKAVDQPVLPQGLATIRSKHLDTETQQNAAQERRQSV